MTAFLWQLLIFILPFGELFRFSFFDVVRIRFTDILLIIILAISFFKNKFEPSFAHPIWIFLGTLLLSVAMNAFTITQPALYYLLRTVLYLQLPQLFEQMNDTAKTQIIKTLSKSFNILLFTGIVQYIFYADLRNLFYVGYDPHSSRLFGAFLDPNLIGLLLVWISWYNLPRFVRIISIGELLLTFSRISWFLFLCGSVFKYMNRKYIGALVGIAFIIGIFLIPKQFGEGNNVMRTNSISAKFISWNAGLKLVGSHPLFGIGFNNVGVIKKSNSIVPDNSLYGFDSSFLTILVTSGIAGMLGFFFLWWYFYQNAKTYFQKMLVISYALHSLSTNSFFTPTIFIYFILIYYCDKR